MSFVLGGGVGGACHGEPSKGLDGKLLAFSLAVDKFLTYSLKKKTFCHVWELIMYMYMYMYNNIFKCVLMRKRKCSTHRLYGLSMSNCWNKISQ